MNRKSSTPIDEEGLTPEDERSLAFGYGRLESRSHLEHAEIAGGVRCPYIHSCFAITTFHSLRIAYSYSHL